MKEPRIVDIKDRKLVGMSLMNMLSEDRTLELWRKFKPSIKAFNFKRGVGFYSLQRYDKGFDMKDFTPMTKFEKWAAVEVESYGSMPDGLEEFKLLGGKYAIFIHKGTPATFFKTAQFIYGEWIPNSKYRLDDRPHFEIMSENYRSDDPDSQEEVWIPIIESYRP